MPGWLSRFGVYLGLRSSRDAVSHQAACLVGSQLLPLLIPPACVHAYELCQIKAKKKKNRVLHYFSVAFSVVVWFSFCSCCFLALYQGFKAVVFNTLCINI